MFPLFQYSWVKFPDFPVFWVKFPDFFQHFGQNSLTFPVFWTDWKMFSYFSRFSSPSGIHVMKHGIISDQWHKSSHRKINIHEISMTFHTNEIEFCTNITHTIIYLSQKADCSVNHFPQCLIGRIYVPGPRRFHVSSIPVLYSCVLRTFFNVIVKARSQWTIAFAIFSFDVFRCSMWIGPEEIPVC